MPGADPLSSDLSRLVSRQLGREPAIGFTAEIFCRYGWPAVIRNDPVNFRGEPHPNLFYLTCPWLRLKLARLEDEGFIDRLQHEIAANQQLLDDLHRCQSLHAQHHLSALEDGGFGSPGKKILIAGASDPELIKCLHSHMAFFLVNPGYLAGQVIADAVGEPWCPDNRCAVMIDELNAADIEAGGGKKS